MSTSPWAAQACKLTPAVPRLWDVFCRVIDNFGDLGVCWRLSADLASRGHTVRLWVDDARALAWMAPRHVQEVPGVSVRQFDDAAAGGVMPGEVVVEAFGCDPPPAFVARMAAMAGSAGTSGSAPVWINLEYLSAEAWVERAHGLPSPQAGGLQKWFFFPGFTAATGGLLREPGLLEQVDAWPRPEGPPRASVFCYPNPQLATLAERFAGDLWLAPGTVPAVPPGRRREGGWTEMAWTDQPGFDRRLWSCDVNFVRGEDSLVRAVWAGRPFVWHIYPQDDGVHRHKLDAFLSRLLEGADPALAADVRALWAAWNGFGPWPPGWPDASAWGEQCRRFRDRQAALPDLVSQLATFVSAPGKGKPS